MTQTTEQTLIAYLSHLTSGPSATKPAPGETWRGKRKRIASFSQIAEVDKETFWHFLEVLPPQWMDGDMFCFAEGMEPLRLFWQTGTRYFCRRLTWNETHRFCDLAGIARDYYMY